MLLGTPDELADKILARFEPLRDSRAHSEPERNQLETFKTIAFLLFGVGFLLEVLMVATSHISWSGALFGLGVIVLGLLSWRRSKRPLQFAPPEPLENLPALSQGLGLCRSLAKTFPNTTMEFEPITSTLRGSCDGYDWEVTVDREGLRPVDNGGRAYDNFTVMSDSGGASAGSRIWRRTSQLVNSHRIVWTVSIDGEFRGKAGRPSEDTSLEAREVDAGKTLCVFTLPINQPKEPGLGHDGRVDFISSPLGLHHPEFVGEEIARSLDWLFDTRIRG